MLSSSHRISIADLQAQGYGVQINWVTGYSRAPRSRCSVAGIHNPDRSAASEKTPTTIYVDVVCPNDDWDWGESIGFGVGIG